VDRTVFVLAFFTGAFAFTVAFFFGAAFFLAAFFLGAFLTGLDLRAAVLLGLACFFFVFLLAIGAVYHRLIGARKADVYRMIQRFTTPVHL
jgi:hypothetical protein